MRWLLFFSSIPLFGIITAFGIAPQTDVQDIEITTVIEQLQLPDSALAAAPASDTPIWHSDIVRRDDTLSSLMARLNIRNDDALAYLRSAAEASALTARLRPGRAIFAQTTEDGRLLALRYEFDTTSALQVSLAQQGYQAHVVDVPLDNRTQMKSAHITSSLFAATDDAEIPDSVAIQIANIFSSDIDFHQDLRVGDRFTVIYEAGYSNGELVAPGKVLAAEFVNAGKPYQAFLHRAADGHESYLTADGRSLNKSFLRSPLEFSRISSGFSLARYHPVLKKWRAHKGVDYAAPTGTRIRATADGVVEFVGRKGGYGNTVILRHQNGVSTLYGHLSRFAGGLSRGDKVRQGDHIGNVGMTGLASGPHLHYEVRVNGEYRDPLKVALPRSQELSGAQRTAFREQARPLIAQLQLMRSYTTAAAE